MWYIFKVFISVFLLVHLAIDSYAQQHSYRNNLGHRGGKSHFEHLPENSLIILEHALRGGPYGRTIQYHKKFKYLELDVQETLDGHLVVFHDRYLRRMIPNRKENNKTYKSLLSNTQFIERTGYEQRYKEFQVQGLTLEELKRFHLLDFPDQSVPTLEEYLSHARQFDLHKPVAIDVKGIQTNEARYLLVAIAMDFLKGYLNEVYIIREYDYEMTAPLVFFAAPSIFKRFIPSEEQRTAFESLDTKEHIPVFYNRRYQGYLLIHEQDLFFVNAERSPTLPVDHRIHPIYQEPLSQCATALH